jgi:hypothetical protein
MTRTMFRRIARLEATRPQSWVPWHSIIVSEGEDSDAQIAAIIASGQAKEGDHFICHVVVSPPVREDAR